VKREIDGEAKRSRVSLSDQVVHGESYTA